METNDEVELSNYGRIFRRGWWLIVLAMVSMTVLAVVLLPGQEAFFRSEVSVLLRPSEADFGGANDPVNEDTEIGIATSARIGVQVLASEPDIDLEEWNENLLVECLGAGLNRCDSQILQFTYNGATAEEAERLVQGSADTYLADRFARAEELRSDRVQDLEAQLADLALRITNEQAVLRAAQLDADGEDSPDVTRSELRLRRLEDEDFNTQILLDEIEDTIEVGSALGEASTPEEGATGIPRLFSLIAGLLMGLVVGALLAILSDRLDRRISGAAETELDLGVPVLGDIPRITEDSPALVAAAGRGTAGAEAFRRLAATVLAPRNGFVVDSLVITGANEREGRTTTAVNLALAISQTGRQVLLVGADRRNDALDRIFGLAGRRGLSDFLRTPGDLSNARDAIDAAEEVLDIFVLPTGTGAPAPMANNSIAALLAVAQERNMIVVFDAPPARTNSEGLQLAAIVDAVYVVSAIGRTKRSELRELRIQLLNVQADLAGSVLNRTSRLNLVPTGSAVSPPDQAVPHDPAGTTQADNVRSLASIHPFENVPGTGGEDRTAQVDEANVIGERGVEYGDRA